MAKEKEVAYFTKVRGLPTVIWDPTKNKPLAEFDRQGLYHTSDPAVMERLREEGYRQVTGEQIVQAGLMMPEAFKAMMDRKPGKGYTKGQGGGTATAMPANAPGESPADHLFEPVVSDLPTGPAGTGRRLVK